MDFDFFKLEKLTIISYKTLERSEIDSEEFAVMFNPSSYSLSYQNMYDRSQGLNTIGTDAKYAISKPQTLKLKLIFDGNGIHAHGIENILFPIENDVSKKIQQFLELTTLMDGDLHQPRPLKLKWADLQFKCRLLNVTINYTQLDASGKPLRAELDTEFLHDIKIPERLRQEGKNSPDLTHYRVVGAHDCLPNMCQKIYGSPNYYLEVAKANNLNDFRNLTTGQKIYFPPIEK